jgi:hypothetical protein
MEEILIQILENQKRLSLALRRRIPFGENEDTPALLDIEKKCEESE